MDDYIEKNLSQSGCVIHDRPRLSIIIITYNSVSTVQETLNSILPSKYLSETQLIICDDGSRDGTVAVCNAWLQEHTAKFFSCDRRFAAHNAGIPANCNNGVRASRGEWIKILAGDDLFISTGLDSFLEANIDAGVIATQYTKFYDIGESRVEVEVIPEQRCLEFFGLSVKEQFKWFSLASFNIAPGAFIKKEVFEKHGLFIEKYRFIEDLPFWLHILRRGEKISFLPIPTVMYRTNSGSLTDFQENYHHLGFTESILKAKRELILPYIPLWAVFTRQEILWDKLTFKIQVLLFKNKKSRWSQKATYLMEISRLRTIYRKLGLKMPLGFHNIKW